jgi:hypothetical protein
MASERERERERERDRESEREREREDVACMVRGISCVTGEPAESVV